MATEYPISPDEVTSTTPLCTYCGFPLVDSDAKHESDDEDVPSFCSTACQTTHETNGEPLPEYDETAHFQTDVSAIDLSLPQGMPRNTLTLLSGSPGTRIHTVLVELAWRALQRNESVVLVCLSDPPLATLQEFLTLKWNIIPYLESGHLKLLDGYTHRTNESFQNRNTLLCNPQTAHIRDVAKKNSAITTISDPSQPKQIERHLRMITNKLGMNCTGTVIVDSLTELGTMVQESQGYEFLKDLRANIVKAQSITVFCGAHFGGYDDDFPYQMEYLFDGLIDLSLNPELVPGLLIKDILVRKMRGVMLLREAHSYEFMEHQGMSVIAPDDSGDTPDKPEEETPRPNERTEDSTQSERRANLGTAKHIESTDTESPGDSSN